MVDNIYSYVEDDGPPEKVLICHICSGTIEVVSSPPNGPIKLYCKSCDEELARLISIESEHEEVKKLYFESLKRIEYYSGLYNQLQDHLKALLS